MLVTQVSFVMTNWVIQLRWAVNEITSISGIEAPIAVPPWNIRVTPIQQRSVLDTTVPSEPAEASVASATTTTRQA
eukprot:SAG31_NODE_7319_length_1720_cov_2.041949_1_plen_75_part_10